MKRASPTAVRRPAPPKLQRWLDLLAALLRRHYPVGFAELAQEVPGYRANSGQRGPEGLRRMFERDKDELRVSGIPIQTITTPEGEVAGYQLQKREFYLPYLSLLTQGRGTRAKRLDREGYRALKELSFEPEELALVAAAARRVEALGDPMLSADARSALRKLAFDLPVDGVATDPVSIATPTDAVAPVVFEALGRALERRKRVSFGYRSMRAEASTVRTVLPYGLFFLGRHWYLAARAPDEPEVKNFRLNRMSDVQVNGARPGSADYSIPKGFRLRDHASSRQAWELGAGDGDLVIVEFAGESGAAQSARRLGEPVSGAPRSRRFRVRRPDVFARWVLSFGGEAVPLETAQLRTQVAAIARQTLARYE